VVLCLPGPVFTFSAQLPIPSARPTPPPRASALTSAWGPDVRNSFSLPYPLFCWALFLFQARSPLSSIQFVGIPGSLACRSKRPWTGSPRLGPRSLYKAEPPFRSLRPIRPAPSSIPHCLSRASPGWLVCFIGRKPRSMASSFQWPSSPVASPLPLSARPCPCRHHPLRSTRLLSAPSPCRRHGISLVCIRRSWAMAASPHAPPATANSPSVLPSMEFVDDVSVHDLGRAKLLSTLISVRSSVDGSPHTMVRSAAIFSHRLEILVLVRFGLRVALHLLNGAMGV
jgi:hypothetical protein